MAALSHSFPESVMKTCSVVLTFESVDEILWCGHSSKTTLVVLLDGNISFFNVLQNEIWEFSSIRIFGTIKSDTTE